jgi:hypothetical protein
MSKVPRYFADKLVVLMKEKPDWSDDIANTFRGKFKFWLMVLSALKLGFGFIIEFVNVLPVLQRR